MNNTFFLFYFPKPRSRVWSLKWSISQFLAGNFHTNAALVPGWGEDSSKGFCRCVTSYKSSVWRLEMETLRSI